MSAFSSAVERCGARQNRCYGREVTPGRLYSSRTMRRDDWHLELVEHLAVFGIVALPDWVRNSAVRAGLVRHLGGSWRLTRAGRELVIAANPETPGNVIPLRRVS